MKKLLLGLLVTGSLALTGCNADLGFGSYSFHYVHVQMYSMSEPVHFKVNTWKSDAGGIELNLVNYGSILLGDGTYMMYDVENCPICGHVEYK